MFYFESYGLFLSQSKGIFMSTDILNIFNHFKCYKSGKKLSQNT